MSVANSSAKIEKNVQYKKIPRLMVMNRTCDPIQGRNRDRLVRIFPSTIRNEERKCVVATIKLE